MNENPSDAELATWLAEIAMAQEHIAMAASRLMHPTQRPEGSE